MTQVQLLSQYVTDVTPWKCLKSAPQVKSALKKCPEKVPSKNKHFPKI